MPEPVNVGREVKPFDGETALADYKAWFARKTWTLHEAAVLIVGLNPKVTLIPETADRYKNSDSTDPVLNQLSRYSEQGWGNWLEIQDCYMTWLWGSYCSDELYHIVEKDTLAVKPMDIVQWCVDENIPMHYTLREYLETTGFEFRFSANSYILSQLQIYGRKEIWYLPIAAKLIIGQNPEATRTRLKGRYNLYRHIDPNYTQTQHDEVYHVMELGLESWKIKNIEFFEIYGDDPEDGYYDFEECRVSVEAHKFVSWALNKGFSPPVQLLEFMGIKSKEQIDSALINTISSDIDQQKENPFYIDFSDLSGEVVLNDVFTIATPEINGQNYKIIRYLIKNPNRFVTVQEIKEKALDGKEIDKRLTDFVAQINLNKDLGKLFFDNGNDSIRLNNPVSAERMAEKAIRRIRIKPA